MVGAIPPTNKKFKNVSIFKQKMFYIFFQQCSYLHERCGMCQFEIKKGFNIWTKKIQYFFKSVKIYMKDAECAETNEKSIFRFCRFLFFELCSFLYSKYGKFMMNFTITQKQMYRNYFFFVFYSLQKVSQLFEVKNQNGSFWERREGGESAYS